VEEHSKGLKQRSHVQHHALQAGSVRDGEHAEISIQRQQVRFRASALNQEFVMIQAIAELLLTSRTLCRVAPQAVRLYGSVRIGALAHMDHKAEAVPTHHIVQMREQDISCQNPRHHDHAEDLLWLIPSALQTGSAEYGEIA